MSPQWKARLSIIIALIALAAFILTSIGFSGEGQASSSRLESPGDRMI